jgi:hypothetical protein
MPAAHNQISTVENSKKWHKSLAAIYILLVVQVGSVERFHLRVSTLWPAMESVAFVRR